MRRLISDYGRISRWKVGLILPVLVLLLIVPINALRNADKADAGSIVPYTVITRESITGPDGGVVAGKEVIQAVRSDGSIVRRHIFPDPANGSERVIRFASGVEVTINEYANTKSSVIKNGNPAQWQRDSQSKCLNSLTGKRKTSMPEIVEGEEIVSGFRAVKVKIDMERPVTFWFALDHGCALIKDRIDFSKSEFSGHDLVNLIPGEPANELFDIPEFLREAPPSERVRGYTRVNAHCGDDCLEKLRKMDEYYFKNKAGN
ncbi:MAG: hypothetical protein AB7H86_22830 [Blastocatellales bacterium]